MQLKSWAYVYAADLHICHLWYLEPLFAWGTFLKDNYHISRTPGIANIIYIKLGSNLN